MKKIKLIFEKGKNGDLNKSKIIFLLLFLIKLGYSFAAPNRVLSATMSDFDGILPVYGTSTSFKYELLINSSGDSDASSSIVSLSGLPLPAGMGCTFSSNTLFVVNGNEVLLPAFSTGGRIFLNFTTAGVGGCFNITPPGSYEGITFTLTSSPSPVISSTLPIVIAKKNLTISNLIAENKVYDGNTNVTFTGGNLVGRNCSDDVSFIPSGNFLNKNVESNKIILTNITLAGVHASRYNLIQPNVLANITAKQVVIQIDDLSKCEGSPAVYANTNFTATGLLGADVVNTITINSPYDTSFEPAGVYEVNGSSPVGVGLSNYYFVFTAGELSINEVPIISNFISQSRCGEGSVQLNATSNIGIINWYENELNGNIIGTGNVFNTPIISTSTSYYAEANNNGCVNSNRIEIQANIYNCTQVKSNFCGQTIANMSDQLTINSVPFATNYQYQAYDGSTTLTWTKGSGLLGFKMSNFVGVKYNTNYQVRVRAFVSGNWQSWGAYCTIISPATKVKDNYCGTVLTSINDQLIIYEAKDATNYQYQAFDGATTLTWTKGSGLLGFKMSNFVGIKYNTTYQVRVRAFKLGNWQNWGNYCVITTPATKVRDNHCGITLTTLEDQLLIYEDNNATNFKYEAFDGTNTLTWTKGSGLLGFKMSNFIGVQYNKTYQVRVSAFVNNVWQNFGAYCVITTPVLRVVNDENLAVKNTSDFLFEVYPNPNSGNFKINSTLGGTFMILNELGQTIKTIELVQENNFEAEIEGLGSGVYIISNTDNSNDQHLFKKLIVK